MPKAPGQSGYDFEELLRAYFLRAGFYVLRGVPVRFEGEDATDIDIWLYERASGTTRRRQGVDAKFKAKPKASERILWARGIQAALGLDGVFVATTDKRPALRTLARKAGVALFDGHDLDRIRASSKVLYDDRLTEEQFAALVRAVDLSRQTREMLDGLQDVKSSVAWDFGPALVNRALDGFGVFSRGAVVSHAGSGASATLGRLSYLAASIAAVGLDYALSEEPFRPLADKRDGLINVIRYGTSNKTEGTEKLRLAAALARQYAVNGPAVAAQISAGYAAGLDAIPAEIIADHAVKMNGDGSLFAVARTLEAAAYFTDVPVFDQLTSPVKAFLGSLLDFSDVSRSKFASSWSLSKGYKTAPVETISPKVQDYGDLLGGL